MNLDFDFSIYVYAEETGAALGYTIYMLFEINNGHSIMFNA